MKRATLKIAGRATKRQIPIFATWSDVPPELIYIAKSQEDFASFAAGFRMANNPPDEHGPNFATASLVTLDHILANPARCAVPGCKPAAERKGGAV
jgi:hypothetical protein